MKTTTKYLYSYSPQDYEQMKAAKEDVFYEDNRGRTFTHFHKGDLLPIPVWEELFGSSKDVESLERNVVQTSQAELDGKALSIEEIQSDNDENYAEKLPDVEPESEISIIKEEEDKKMEEATLIRTGRKKRAKSIIKRK